MAAIRPSAARATAVPGTPAPGTTTTRRISTMRSRRRVRADIPYINRELSWLEFNERVLHEAIDERNPLLERLKFLAIFNTNLDEFYMVRAAGLRRQVAAGLPQAAADGMSPADQLAAI